MTLRDALCFLLLGTILPAVFMAVTGSPWILILWLVLWIATTVFPR